MGIYLNPGNAAFQKARRSQIYVDKTGLIAYANRVLDTQQQNICISRPRRFGKSMAANMLCAYYDRTCDSRELFAGLEIEKDSSFEQHLSQYDVLFWCTWDIWATMLSKKRYSFPMKKFVKNLKMRLKEPDGKKL